MGPQRKHSELRARKDVRSFLVGPVTKVSYIYMFEAGKVFIYIIAVLCEGSRSKTLRRLQGTGRYVYKCRIGRLG